jgi:16S rRNA C1402 N4-methylase RsmH
MPAETLELLAPAARQSALPVFVDCTFGAGGHTIQILTSIPGTSTRRSAPPACAK